MTDLLAMHGDASAEAALAHLEGITFKSAAPADLEQADSSSASLADAALQDHWHPIANCWPLVDGPDFEALCASIREVGQAHPIVRYEGKTLDGRNRERACRHLGIEPTYTEYTGDDPVGYARACNEARRHLTASQRAAVAARLSNLGRGRKSAGSADLTQAEAAKKCNVSVRSTGAAKRVLKKAPKLFTAIETGTISVETAARLTDQPAAVQTALVEKLASGVDATTAIREAVPHVAKETDPVAELVAAYNALSESDKTRFQILIADVRRAAIEQREPDGLPSLDDDGTAYVDRALRLSVLDDDDDREAARIAYRAAYGADSERDDDDDGGDPA
jgi:hypothetical protein